MPNAYLNTDWVAKRVLRFLINGLELGEMFDTSWSDEFKKDFAVGDTITVKKPQRWTIRTGMAYSPQSLARQSTTIVLNETFGIDFEWDDYEKAVKLERGEAELDKNYFEPAGNKLKQEIESRCAQYAYLHTPNTFGALGTNPTTSTPFLDADGRLFNKSAPDGQRKMIISSAMMASFVGNQTVQFNPASEIAQQYKKGVVGMHAGFEWYRSNSLYRHTAGAWNGAVTVNLAGQSGSTLNVTCTTGDTFLAGDVFSIVNVNFLNPNTLRVPGSNQVQHFLVTANATGAVSAAALSIFPAIVGPGSPYQNVDALPANAAALTSWPGTSSPNGKSGAIGLALTKNAFALVGAKFDRPNVGDVSYARDSETGLSIRFWRLSDIDASKTKNRFDMCIGFGQLYPDECAVRVVGA